MKEGVSGSAVVLALALSLSSACSGAKSGDVLGGSSDTPGPNDASAEESQPPLGDAAAEAATPVDATTSDAEGTETTPGDEAGGEAEAAARCSAGSIACDDDCVSPTDVHSCGACSHDCTSLAHVSGAVECLGTGQCSVPPSSCAAGWGHCTSNPDQGCETDFSSISNCGGCGVVCSGGTPYCSSASGVYACVSGCPSGTPTLCGTNCVDTANDPNNCGACGMGCTTAVAHAEPQCVGAACTLACDADYSACNGACVDYASDAANCGGCGKACKGGMTCHAGACACPAGTHDCGGTCKSSTSPASCGARCGACPAPANGNATCDGKECGIACKGGYAQCDGACVNEKTDANNCGHCGVHCSAAAQPPNTMGMECAAGACRPVQCVSGFAHCSPAAVTTAGCETSTQNNAGGAGVPCGACANAITCKCDTCPASMSGMPAACTMGACEP
jgi:hypothetical protein